MFIKLIKLFYLMNPEQRRKFAFLQILVIVMAIFELIGIASIGPFMVLVSDFSVLEGDNFIARIYSVSGLTNHYDFTFLIGILVLLLLLIGSFISMYTTWVLSIFGQEVGVKIGDRLFEFYLNKPWLYHTSVSSSTLTKQISVEANRITTGVITPLMQLNSKIITAIFISIALLFYNPLITISALIIFTLSYYIIYRIVRYRLSINGDMVSQSSKERFKLMAEGFGGVRDILLSRCQNNYVNTFVRSGDKYSHHHGETIALAHVPRYIMEFVVFGSLIIFLLYLLNKYNGEFGMILPVLSIYTLASFKIIPALQQIYASIVLIRGNISSFDSIKQDLEESFDMANNSISKNNKSLLIRDSIELNGIQFTYPGKNIPAIEGLNIKIPVNKIIGISGSSGSGKSTIIDILIGLIQSDKGEILIDGTPLLSENIGNWQDKIGFVAQSIFLSDASIMENIAFGLSKNDIDISKVHRAIELSHLSKVIAELPKGVETMVGERGVQLSGGQRQRIGIARALYHDPEILIFDEATSALDGTTEKTIMDAIHDFSGLKTIIMIAHRLTTLKKCDLIYFIDQGRVVDSGNFENLINNNSEFKKMANLSLSD